MLSDKIQKLINAQIGAENYSANLYYSMAAYFDSLSLKGFSHWLRVQALEELTHAHRFFTYVGERSGRVQMKGIDAPPTEWKSPLACFEAVYEHEIKVTGLINKLMDAALSQSDHATVNFLQWFIAEQVEEEATADEVVHKLKLVDKTEGGLFLLDQEMNKRTFVLPVDLVGAF